MKVSSKSAKAFFRNVAEKIITIGKWKQSNDSIFSPVDSEDLSNRGKEIKQLQGGLPLETKYLNKFPLKLFLD